LAGWLLVGLQDIVVGVRLSATVVLPAEETDMCRGWRWSARDLIALALLTLEMAGGGEGGRGELRGDPGEFLDRAGETFFLGERHCVHRTALE